MTLKLIRKKPRDELEELAIKYNKLERRMMKLKIRNSDLFKELEELYAEQEGVKIRIQEIARRRALEGQEGDLVARDDIIVNVSVPREAVRYDYSRARKYWPREVFDTCLVLDHKMADELIRSGELDKALAKKAAMPQELMTPRVSIKPLNDE